MEILGRDTTLEAYRVATGAGEDRVVAVVPEHIMAAEIAKGPRHQGAYEWLARHNRQIEAAIAALIEGSERVKPPFDALTLVKE